MKKKPLLLVSAFAILAFSACKKDKTKTELLTDGSWKMTAASISPAQDFNGDGVPDDFFQTFPACEKDNVLTFKEGGTWVDDEGATKCDAADPQSTTGTWAFKENESKIELITPNVDTALATIITLDESTFKFNIKVGDPADNTIVTITYGK